MLQRTLQPGSVVTSNLPRAQGLAAQLFCKRNWLLTPPWCIWPLQPALLICHQQD